MRALVFAAALALVSGSALAQTTPIPAPLPDGAVAISADQSGQTIAVNVGGRVAIDLQRNPSAGTNWVVTSKPDFVGEPTALTAQAVSSSSSHPILGAPMWQVFVFAVNDGGSGDIVIEKHDRAGATIETFTVTVNATAQ
jgi:hypothetical protein